MYKIAKVTIASLVSLECIKITYNLHCIDNSPEPFFLLPPWRFESNRYANRFPENIMALPEVHMDWQLICYLEEHNPDNEVLLTKLCLALKTTSEYYDTDLRKDVNGMIKSEWHYIHDGMTIDLIDRINFLCRREPQTIQIRDSVLDFKRGKE